MDQLPPRRGYTAQLAGVVAAASCLGLLILLAGLQWWANR